MSKSRDEYLSPPHKVINFLKKGHVVLRAKYTDLRVKLRRSENQVRVVTKSRENWKKRANAAEAELRELKKRVGDVSSASRLECSVAKQGC